MKQGIVKFSKEFITPTGLKEWVGIEYPFDLANNEDPKWWLTQARNTVEQWHKETNHTPHPISAESVVYGPPPIINVQRTSEDTRIAELVRDIYACTQLDGDNGLWSYSKLATTCKEAELAYEVMGKKLRAKESQQLLDTTEEYYKNMPKSKKK